MITKKDKASVIKIVIGLLSSSEVGWTAVNSECLRTTFMAGSCIYLFQIYQGISTYYIEISDRHGRLVYIELRFYQDLFDEIEQAFIRQRDKKRNIKSAKTRLAYFLRCM